MCAFPLSLALPPVWLPEGLRRSEDYSITAHRRAARNSRSDPNQSTSAILAGSETGGHHRSPYVYELVLRGATICGTQVIAPELLH
jgi:hypothetical protein